MCTPLINAVNEVLPNFTRITEPHLGYAEKVNKPEQELQFSENIWDKDNNIST